MKDKSPSFDFQSASPVEGEAQANLLPQLEKVSEEGMRVSKQQLRKWAKEERKKLDILKISEKLVCKLMESEEYKHAKNIMLFYPKENEIDLLALLDDKTKNFYLPKIQNKDLLCCPYGKGDDFCESCFKTKEPLSDSIDKNLLDLVIVPALAVDKNNYRLGYGGGFYDRFLSDLVATKITCISQVLIVETVYPESHDVKLDAIICA